MTYAPTPTAPWGKDHWSTLASVEPRIVDYRGRLDARPPRGQMEQGTSDPDRYPTRLKGGAERTGHNDFDCIADMIAHGLLTVDGDDELGCPPYSRRIYRRMYRLLPDLRFGLTPLGDEVASALRTHKAHQGRFSDFELPASVSVPEPIPA